ncbi:DUF6290 family protein [Anaerovorax odorimutans]|uniref:DUF6290 family protein n=1 Tax=Anaerovorax odorimutans TaxID=109327 RepID=A0ABT1RRL8_9FIRM|nr:DUF6290 family protein [Anaerovorax odorimutans]MCQ4637845.1 DUF6290 family protein [Anaerovorax odorimutans]
MAISIRLNEMETELIKSYAEAHGISVSELIRQSVLEKIEDEIDLRLYQEAKEDFERNPKTYTLDEAEKELGLK